MAILMVIGVVSQTLGVFVSASDIKDLYEESQDRKGKFRQDLLRYIFRLAIVEETEPQAGATGSSNFQSTDVVGWGGDASPRREGASIDEWVEYLHTKAKRLEEDILKSKKAAIEEAVKQSRSDLDDAVTTLTERISKVEETAEYAHKATFDIDGKGLLRTAAGFVLVFVGLLFTVVEPLARL